ncbi:MAG: hypothetical protein ACI8TP_000760 [Acidimicrobiales bacterium]|jgi:hypothetical protein
MNEEKSMRTYVKPAIIAVEKIQAQAVYYGSKMETDLRN